MTSTAYGVSRDSFADALAERCPVSAFFVTPVYRVVCLMKNAAPGTRRRGGIVTRAGIPGAVWVQCRRLEMVAGAANG